MQVWRFLSDCVSRRQRPVHHVRFLWLLFLMLPCMFVRAEDTAPAPPARPNIVFVVVDDLRWNVPGFAGDPVAVTPHLDALAKAGTVFENAFTTTSICSVSRATFLTGQTMRRHGIRDFARGLSPEQWSRSYPVLLREKGYRTGVAGKWGVGDAAAVKEAAAHYDFWRGEAGQGAPDFIDPKDPSQTHQTARIGNDAVEFVATSPGTQPFFLAINFTAVHARDGRPREFQPDTRDEALCAGVAMPMPPTATEEAFQRLPEFVKKSEGRTRQRRRFATPEMAQGILRDYYRLLTGVDREMGRLREALRERGLEKNTVILFTSDNGFALGDRGLADKWFMWEEDIRVPAFIYDPRVPEPQRGRKVGQIALNVDFAPTILDAAGIAPPDVMQGRSLMPFAQGQTPSPWRTEFYYEHVTLPQIIPPCEGIRTETWKYIRWTGREPVVEELYDLAADPWEERNLASDAAHAPRLAELRAATDRLADEAR